METSNRPFTSELLRLTNVVQDGGQPVDSLCNTEEWLDDLHQSEGYVPSGSCASQQPLFSPVCCGWKGLPVQSALFWSLHGPSGVHQGHGSCVFHASRRRHPDTPVSGQLVSLGLFQERGPVGKGRCSESLSPAWNCGQPGQVSPQPLSHPLHDPSGVHLNGAVVCQEAGGLFLTALNQETQLLLLCAESWELTLVPQFIMGPRTWWPTSWAVVTKC